MHSALGLRVQGLGLSIKDSGVRTGNTINHVISIYGTLSMRTGDVIKLTGSYLGLREYIIIMRVT